MLKKTIRTILSFVVVVVLWQTACTLAHTNEPCFRLHIKYYRHSFSFVRPDCREVLLLLYFLFILKPVLFVLPSVIFHLLFRQFCLDCYLEVFRVYLPLLIRFFRLSARLHPLLSCHLSYSILFTIKC